MDEVAMDMPMSGSMEEKRLRKEINFEKLFSLEKEQKEFYLKYIEDRTDQFTEEINNYLERYDGNVFKMEKNETRDYIIKLVSEMKGWNSSHLIKQAMEAEGLIIDHREAIIDEVLD